MNNPEKNFYQPFLSKEPPALIRVKAQHNDVYVLVSMRPFHVYTSVQQINIPLVETRVIFEQCIDDIETFSSVITFYDHPENIYLDKLIEDIKPGESLTIHIGSGKIEPIEFRFHSLSEVVIKYVEDA